MKKLLLSLLLCSFMYHSYGQSIGVNGATVSKDPAKKNEILTYSFTFVTVPGNPAISHLPTPVRFTISLQKLTPVLVGGAPQITGAGSEYFAWAWDQSATTIYGVQNQTIPANAPPATFSFNAVVTEESPGSNGTTTGQGINVNITPGIATQIQNMGSTSIYGYTNGALPVVFGPIQAQFNNNQFSVNWQTTSEKNNKEFIVQASDDGKEFHTIGTVASKAEEGNSDTALDYSFSKTWDEVSSLLSFPLISAIFLCAMMLALFVKRSRKAYFLPVLVVLAFASFMGCRKKDRVEITELPDVYVRIGQVNIDGATEYSQAVKAIKE